MLTDKSQFFNSHLINGLSKIDPAGLIASLNNTAKTEATIFNHLEKQQADKAFAIYRDFEFQQQKLTQQQAFNELQAALKQQATSNKQPIL